jgi:gamma-glutamyl-gamma-aminobutyrate hydrolase PuuD
MSRDVLVFMVPTVDKEGLLHRSNIRVADYARALDGLVLQGGSDVSPSTYGEQPLSAEWVGDRLRDVYEIELVHEFVEARKPVLGICRGAQMINVFLGGSLHTDIYAVYEHAPWQRTALPRKTVHVTPDSKLGSILECLSCRVNALHHQSIDQLGRELRVVARDDHDMIQAIEDPSDRFVIGVQWHPEFLIFDRGQRRLFRRLVEAARGE